MQSLGPFGIFLLMALENLFPPIPSELIMPLAGYQAAQGVMPLWLVILSGSLGSLTGTLPWYVLGRVIGKARLLKLADRFGRWMTLSPADIEKADHWLDTRGWRAVLFGRLVPTVRSLISIPAGLSDMPLGRFLLYSAIGTVIWTSLLALAGFWLGQGYARIAIFVDPVSTGVVVLIVAIYVYRVVTFRPTR
jgi:membrane protein DedA with SNARE-associated domain